MTSEAVWRYLWYRVKDPELVGSSAPSHQSFLFPDLSSGRVVNGFAKSTSSRIERFFRRIFDHAGMIYHGPHSLKKMNVEASKAAVADGVPEIIQFAILDDIYDHCKDFDTT
mgnify:CR=1 FL=1